jgi:hypothetical protein
MKGKVLSFPFIYFSESGLFNGLRPIQIKKLSPVSASPQMTESDSGSHLLCAALILRRPLDPASREHSTRSSFSETNVAS